MSHRTCRICNVQKILEQDYARNYKMKDGTQRYTRICKLCDNARRSADWKTEGSKTRWKTILRMYGITREQWEAMWEAQGQCCGCCRATVPGKGRNWHTEHDHTTKKFRGITCLSCNVMMGAARDTIERLQMGIDYLRRTCEDK